MATSSRSLALVALAALLSVAGCKPEEAPASKAAPADEKAPKPAAEATPADEAAPEAKPAKPKAPPEARRDSAPEAVEASALALGASAPAMTQIASTTGPWTREKPTVLVFYRGHW